MAGPLRVYRDSVFVEPGNVNDALTDAMVEVYFHDQAFPHPREEV
jgi:hypothetical protein